LRTDLALQALAPGGRPRVLLVHGERDRLIPMQHSAALAALAPGATLRRIPGAGHGDLQDFDAYLQTLREALRAATD
jgi:pimeloyl-ACP methyl ester carboxylesterase